MPNNYFLLFQMAKILIILTIGQVQITGRNVKTKIITILSILTLSSMVSQPTIELWTQKITIENRLRDKFTLAIGRLIPETEFIVNVEAELTEETVKQKAYEVIDFLNLKHLANELAGNLSGGQKKLLELGRTMMVDAKIVLLDEVGAGVNRTLLKDIGTAIQRLNKEKGYTFCMIEHDMDFIKRMCDPVIVMAEGSVLFEGTPDEVMKNEKVIESYLGRANTK